MTCFDTGVSALLNIEMWVKWASVLAPIIAFFAIFYQLRHARIESKRAIAHAAYDSYLELCINNTELSFGCVNERVFDEDTFKKYRWFVSKMLFSFEQILEVYPGDDTWRKAIKNQLSLHKFHLSNSQSVKRKEWNPLLLEIINNL